VISFGDALGNHHPVDGSEDLHGACDITGGFQPFYLVIGDIPVGQALAAGLLQIAQAAFRRTRRQLTLLADRFTGNQKLSLGGYEIGGINLKHDLALAYSLPHVVDMESFYPAVYLQVNVIHPGFAKRHFAERADFPGENLRPDRRGNQPHILTGHWINRNRTGMTHTVFLGSKFHLANRTVTGFIGDDFRVHPTGVLLLFNALPRWLVIATLNEQVGKTESQGESYYCYNCYSHYFTS